MAKADEAQFKKTSLTCSTRRLPGDESQKACRALILDATGGLTNWATQQFMSKCKAAASFEATESMAKISV